MQKFGNCLLALTVCFALSAKNYESFEHGVPANWKLRGKGKLSVSPYHYKHGKQSLKWDWVGGDKIQVRQLIGKKECKNDVYRKSYPYFGIHIYCPEPLKGKYLRFYFKEKDDYTGHLKCPLNFKAWQFAFASYMHKKSPLNSVTAKTDTIIIKAPKKGKGTLFIDLVVYKGQINNLPYGIPRKTPWEPPKVDEKLFPLPGKVSAADLAAIKRYEKDQPNITIIPHDNPRIAENIKELEKLELVEDKHGVRGKGITYVYLSTTAENNYLFASAGIPADELMVFNDINYKILKRTASERNITMSKKQYNELKPLAVKFIKYLVDSGFTTSQQYPMYYVAHKGGLFRFMWLWRRVLKETGVKKEVMDYLQYHNFGLYSKPSSGSLNMDYFSVLCRGPFRLALMFDDPRKKVQALRFLSSKISSEILNSTARDGFKADGSAFHHQRNYYGYAVCPVYRLCYLAKMFKSSSFELSPKALRHLKKIVLNMYFYVNTHDLSVALAMRGRKPFNKKTPGHYRYYLIEAIKALALAMGQKDSVDIQLAQAYLNLNPEDTTFAKKYNVKTAAYPSGNLSMPYGGLMVQRRRDYLAVANAYGKYFCGTECYFRGGCGNTNTNSYALYGSDCSLQLMGKDGFAGDIPGFDWNRISGTTVAYLTPEKIYAKNKIINNLKMTPYGFFGGISWWKLNGCFAMPLGGEKCIVKAKKSYFFIDERIYALGSNISCAEKDAEVQTNLYQNTLDSKNSPTFVDGKKIAAFPENKILDSKAHYLLDAEGNGYYIPSGQKTAYARKAQKNPSHDKKKTTTGIFATAWLGHGVRPDNAAYEYVILPFCGEKRLLKFSSDDYKILQKDSNAHIVHDKISDIYAAVFWGKQEVNKLNPVSQVGRACMIMYKPEGKKLKITVGDPDTNRRNANKKPSKFDRYGWRGSMLNPLKVTFKGRWKLPEAVNGVKIISSNREKTIIQFACIDGKSFDFILERK